MSLKITFEIFAYNLSAAGRFMYDRRETPSGMRAMTGVVSMTKTNRNRRIKVERIATATKKDFHT